MDRLEALCPLDGRYRHLVEDLAPLWSEYGLIRHRVEVEIEYLIALHEILPEHILLSEADIAWLRDRYRHFSIEDARRIKEIEAVTNHDVKAVEYWLREQMQSRQLDRFIPWIHFGLTSQDVNNVAIPLMLKRTLIGPLCQRVHRLVHTLADMAEQWADIAMLAFTHGQPASPTTLGKEIAVFAYRIAEVWKAIWHLPVKAKFGGATGTLAAHYLTFPQINWREFAERFLQRLGLEPELITTQISNYDNLGQHLDLLRRLATILIDLSQDLWLYISRDYLKLKVIDAEVGSSAMPHKVNPIHFENAEGNLQLARPLLATLADELPVSRLQRDLTDSTQLRYTGTAIGMIALALQNIQKGLGRIAPNEATIQTDLERHYEVLAEALQVTLRAQQVPNAYELVKQHTRGSQQTATDYQHLVSQLPLTPEHRERLLQLTPAEYTGDAARQARRLAAYVRELFATDFRCDDTT